MQAVEDELRTFPATEVILATGSTDRDTIGNAAATELESRLQVEFHHLVIDSADTAARNSHSPCPRGDDPRRAMTA